MALTDTSEWNVCVNVNNNRQIGQLDEDAPGGVVAGQGERAGSLSPCLVSVGRKHI